MTSGVYLCNICSFKSKLLCVGSLHKRVLLLTFVKDLQLPPNYAGVKMIPHSLYHCYEMQNYVDIWYLLEVVMMCERHRVFVTYLYLFSFLCGTEKNKTNAKQHSKLPSFLLVYPFLWQAVVLPVPYYLLILYVIYSVDLKVMILSF